MLQHAQVSKVEEYVGAKSISITVMRIPCSNKQNAERFVAAVKRETDLPFYWEEESTGVLRFFTERSVTEDELQAILKSAQKNSFESC